MKSIFIVLSTAIISTFNYSCHNKTESSVVPSKIEKVDTVEFPTKETQEMVVYLDNLYKNAVVDENLYLNRRKADKLFLEISDPETPYQGQKWFEYCAQLLRAGDSRACILELESHFDQTRLIGEQMTPQNSVLIELLAIAHLRAGEQENCQNNHTEYSCILPLEAAAIHQIPEGSSTAIYIYQQMYDRQPLPTYKWLINLAYMTLGKHPTEVPKKYIIEYPNWNLERKSFTHLKDVSLQTQKHIT